MVQGIGASQQIYANPKDTYFAPKALKENNRKAHGDAIVSLISLPIFLAMGAVQFLIAGAVTVLSVVVGIIAWPFQAVLTLCFYRFFYDP